MSATGMSSRYSLAALERVEDALDREDVGGPVRGGERRQRIGHVARKIVALAQRGGQWPRFRIATEDEQREAARITSDRGLGLRSAELERPAGRFLGSGPVAGDHERLHRADRPAPAPGRRLDDALAVALRRAVEPLGRLIGATRHQQREAGSARRIAHPGQLPLPGVRVGRVGQPPLAVAVALGLPLGVRSPVRHTARQA